MPLDRARAAAPVIPSVAAVLLAAVLAVAPATARGGASLVSDPEGDTKGPKTASLDQRDTVDLTGVSFASDSEQLVISASYTDLRDDVKGNQFLDTRFKRKKGSWIIASSELGSSKVTMFDGTHLYPCKDGRASTDLDADVIVQQIPVSCLEGFKKASARSVSSLLKDNGSRILHDRAGKVALNLS